MNKTIILAIGGAGCNMADYCKRNAGSDWLKKADFIFADTDTDNILRISKDGHKTLPLCLNSTGNPFTGFKQAENIIILAGLGGETGSLFSEIAAKAAQSEGVENVSLVLTTPFLFEGDGRIARSADVVKQLSGFNIRILSNEDLTSRYPDLDFFNAFELSDKEVLKIIEDSQAE